MRGSLPPENNGSAVRANIDAGRQGIASWASPPNPWRPNVVLILRTFSGVLLFQLREFAFDFNVCFPCGKGCLRTADALNLHFSGDLIFQVIHPLLPMLQF